ncbi:MAG: ABC transporter substrate-binding protein [Cypionkella sp.]
MIKLILAATLALATASQAETLRIATQISGTVNWELSTITARGLDKANGFNLQIQDVAAGPAAQIAFQGGQADVIVSDWLWVARQRAEGRDFVFIPYSRAVGALYVPATSTAQTLPDLATTQIGIAGGPVDKSWLILRAYAQTAYGFDLAGQTQQVFGAPPLIYQTALDGQFGGAINFWNFGAKMQAAGMRPLITISDAALALGLNPDTPLLGYVVQGQMLRDHPDLIAGLAKASRAAKDILARDDTAWDALRPLMNAKSDAEFAALKDGFRQGIPAAGPVDEAAAGKMLTLMASLGGAELVGNLTTLPPGTFYTAP